MPPPELNSDAYNHAEAPLNLRKLNFVYFFHREPSRFSGGDLLLYDTDTDTGVCSYDRFFADCPASQQHRLLPQRLLAPSDPGAMRNGRLRGRQVGRARPRVAARPEGPGPGGLGRIYTNVAHRR